MSLTWLLIIVSILLFIWYTYRSSVATPPEEVEPDTRKFKSVGEKLSVKALEDILGRRVLVNIRPDFLKNPVTKRNLELDAYDPETKVALEYNGIQHYEFSCNFHKSYKDFQKQVNRDLLKKKLCNDVGIKLIDIPYTVDKNAKSESERYSLLRNYILQQL